MLGSLTEKRALFADLHDRGETGLAGRVCDAMLEGAEGDERLRWTNNLSLVRWREGRPAEALALLVGVADLARGTRDDRLAGNYHNNAAAYLMALWHGSEDEDLLDRALVSFEGAAYHYERAAEPPLTASTLNNVATVMMALGRVAEALPKLAEARAIYLKAGLREMAAQVDETEARARLRMGQFEEAERLASRAVSALTGTEHRAARDEARETLKDALAAADAHAEPKSMTAGA